MTKKVKLQLTNRAWNNGSLLLPLHHQNKTKQVENTKPCCKAWLFYLPTVKDIGNMNSLKDIRAP